MLAGDGPRTFTGMSLYSDLIKFINSFKKFFDKHYKDNTKTEGVENFLKDLYRYAKFYRKFIYKNNKSVYKNKYKNVVLEKSI